MIEFVNKRGNFRDKIECPTCKSRGCFEHCYRCGDPIIWKDEQGDSRYETINGRRVRTRFNPDFSVHKCLSKNIKDSTNKDELVYYQYEGVTYRYYPREKINVKEYDYQQQYYTCIECTGEFNHEIYPLCPVCWKKECRSCGNLQSYIYRGEQDMNKCFNCGHNRLDVTHVWNSYFRLYGKPSF